MRLVLMMSVLIVGQSLPASADECMTLVASACPQGADSPPAEVRFLRVESTVTAVAVGDRFPVEARSLLMDPKRYGLPGVDGQWRYYAMNGVVYRVANETALVLDTISDRRTQNLR